jgi:uncharacterized protein (DUF934 family)
MTLVTPEGFVLDRWRRLDAGAELVGSRVVVPLARLDEALAAGLDGVGVELAADADLGLVLRRLRSLDLIVLRFESFTDGRGFSLARRLRQFGFTGRLRAAGHVIPDQWAFLRDCGVDEVEIDDALARRQGEAAWRAAAGAITGSYQRRLAGGDARRVALG